MSRTKLPLHVVKDGVKWLMLPSKVLLEIVSAWPESHNYLILVINWFVVVSFAVIMYGNFYYITRENVDLGAAANALTKLTVVIESTMRHILAFFYRGRLVKVLHTVYYEFDPSNKAGPALDMELRKESRQIFIFCVFYISAAFICGMQYMATTIITKNTPLITSFPFPWNNHPVHYGIVYCWQSFLTVEVVINICTTDIFFVSLLYNCVAQFKLLRAHILNNFESAPDKAKFIAYCVQKHNHLIGVCEELNSIFSLFILIEFLIGIGAVCLSAFIATAIPELVGDAFSYLMGHLCALLIYCYMGNELIIHSLELSDAIYFCGWHLCDTDSSIQKGILFIMLRAQKSVKIWASGFGYLTLTNFMKLIKFSFSVYTLLNAMLEKQNAVE